MKRELHRCVYMMTNKGHRVLYTGVTSNLFRRASQHKEKSVAGFTSAYNATKLRHCEGGALPPEAISVTVKEIASSPFPGRAPGPSAGSSQ